MFDEGMPDPVAEYAPSLLANVEGALDAKQQGREGL